MADEKTTANETANETEKETTKSQEIDINGLSEILGKRIDTAMNGVIKSYSNQNGLSQEEVKQALESFTASKAEKEIKTNPEFVKLQGELDGYKNQLLEMNIKSEVSNIASELGIDSKNMQYVLKLADIKSGINEDGKLDSDKIKTAINKVLEDIPALKTTQTQKKETKIVKIGATEKKETETDTKDELRKLMGIKEKK